jgi:lipopolysaccharide export system permease protein
MLPLDVYSLFPIAGLLGSLLGLGALASHSELTIMRAAGMSLWQIIKIVLKTAIWMLVFMLFIGECIAPHAARQATLSKAAAELRGEVANTIEGVWVRDENSFFHIQQVMPGKFLNGVSQYVFDKHRLVKASFAKSATYQDDQWLLHDIEQTEFQQNRPSTRHLEQEVLTAHIKPTLAHLTEDNPNTLSLFELWQFIAISQENGMNAQFFSLTFWQRILQPISMLIMIFLAIPFVFGPLRSSPMGVKIVVGVMVGFSFYVLDEFFGPFSLVYQIPPLIGAVLPPLVFCLIAYLLMRRVS